jgi:gliding motility-associated-like protein
MVSLSAPGDGAKVGCEWLLWVGAPSPTVNNNCNTSFQFPAGSYPVQLVVTDINGCTDTIIKTVKSDSLSQLEIYPGDTTICLGDAIQYTVSGVFDQIVWQPSVWVDNPYSPVVTIQPEGNISYIVSATNGVCTSANDTFSIRTLQPIPITVEAVPQQVVLGLSSSISSQIPGRIDSVIWSPDLTLDCRECPNPIALPTQTTTYTATIYYSENGTTCTNSDSVTIEVLKVCDNSVIYIPNTFTPNGDGLNDVFMIRGLAATKINNFRVFDRWGKLVFEATKGEPNEPRWGWDGNDASGKKLNAAVYVYTYEIECINGDIVTGKGNITLIR